jgi:rhomboid family protein
VFPLKTTVLSRHVPVVTWVIIALNVLVFYSELQLSPDGLERMTYLLGMVPARFTHPAWAQRVGFPVDDYWPFLTSLFIHGGWLHLIGNMWTLWVFGVHVEDRMGPWRYLAFYLLCGIAAGITHTFVNAGSTIPAIGASGAIAGIMGAYLVMFPRSRVIVMIPIIIFPFIFDFPAVLFLLYWFGLQLLSGTLALTATQAGGGIAFWAHVGGFLFGAMAFGIFLRPRAERRVAQPDEGDFHHAFTAFR